MAGRIVYSFNDYDGEGSAMSVRAIEMTVANIDSRYTAVTALAAALAGVTLGRLAKTSIVAREVIGSPLPAASDSAQREQKWFVRMHEGTSLTPFTFEIPCANTAILDPASRDHMLVASGAGLTFVEQLEATVVGPNDELGIVDEVILVHRRT